MPRGDGVSQRQIESGAQPSDFRYLGRHAGACGVPRVFAGYMQQVLDGLSRERDGARVPNILFTKVGVRG